MVGDERVSTRLDDVEREVRRVLDELTRLPSPDDVALTLREAHAYGVRQSSLNCPLGVYLRRRCAVDERDVSVRVYWTAITLTDRDRRWGRSSRRLELHDTLSGFVKQFDAGAYSVLQVYSKER